MKRLAFVFGYAGSILALIFALFMIYTVPFNIVTDNIEDIKDDVENENVLAFNEVALAMIEEGTSDYSEQALEVFAQQVAQNSRIINDEDIYEDTVEIFYDLGWQSLVSMVLVAISILFALIAFIGALICRKAPAGGGITMLAAALVLLLASIYTRTLIPMLFASLLLTIGGIAVFIPKPQKKENMQYAGGPYYQPSLNQQQPYEQNLNAPPVKTQSVPAVQKTDVSSLKGSVPFPNEETQVFDKPDTKDDKSKNE